MCAAVIKGVYHTGAQKPEYLPIHVNRDGMTDLTVVNLPDLAALMELGDAATLKIPGAPARGVPLFTNGHLGADMLYVAPGDSFPLHVHPGHHFLACIKGEGTVTFAGRSFPVRPGDLYMIEASVPHAVGATADGPGHWLVAFGAPHKALDSEHRMELLPGDDSAVT
jgi:quercetin dioxygenase-like cupin family protein